MKKKILVDLLNLASPKIAGVGIFTRNLLTLWLADKDLPYLIVFVSSSSINAEEVFGFKCGVNIAHKRVRSKHVLLRFLYQQLILPFTLLKHDAYFNPAVGLPFLARIITPKTKLIVTIHDVAPFFFLKSTVPCDRSW